ncbi:class I lanthipeptide [Ferruginibacter sp. SUN106]|uniref:class I lanthipeptide n=1 Tax=Ferruginibacter sp. SUN106 TaxID=2978348 RepID=UPI003D362285
MKEIKTKSKLQLKKQAICNLSNSELKAINGGIGDQVTETRVTFCCSQTCGECTTTLTTITETIVTITLL